MLLQQPTPQVQRSVLMTSGNFSAIAQLPCSCTIIFPIRIEIGSEIPVSFLIFLPSVLLLDLIDIILLREFNTRNHVCLTNVQMSNYMGAKRFVLCSSI